MANRGEGKDARAVAHRCVPGHRDMRHEFDALAKLDLGADMAERPDPRGGGDARAGLDNGTRMDVCNREVNCP